MRRTGGNTDIVISDEDYERQRSRRDHVTDAFGEAYREHLEEQKARKAIAAQRRKLLMLAGVLVLAAIVIVVLLL